MEGLRTPLNIWKYFNMGVRPSASVQALLPTPPRPLLSRKKISSLCLALPHLSRPLAASELRAATTASSSFSSRSVSPVSSQPRRRCPCQWRLGPHAGLPQVAPSRAKGHPRAWPALVVLVRHCLSLAPTLKAGIEQPQSLPPMFANICLNCFRDLL